MTARRLVWGSLSLVALAVGMIGVPVALAVWVGWPLPRRPPSWAEVIGALGDRGIPDQTLIKALAVACWIAWAGLLASVITEAVAVVTGRPSPRLRLAGPIQPAARVLVAAVAAMVLSAPSRETTRPERPLEVALAARAAPAVELTALAATESPPTEPSVPAEPPAPTHTVGRWETLWGIAEARLGDGRRWQELHQLNAGRPQPDGECLSDPDHIHPGWILQLPPDAQPTLPEPVPPLTPPGPPAPTIPAVPAETTPTPSPNPSTAPAPERRRALPEYADEAPDLAISVELPSGSVVALSFAAGVASALTLDRLRRRRHYQPQPPAPGLVGPARAASTPARLERAAAQAGPSAHSAPPGPLPRPGDPAPATIDIGERHGAPVTLDLAAAGLIAIAGPGAFSVIRSLAVALVGHAAPEDVEVRVALPTWTRLFPHVEPFPGLTSQDEASLLTAAEVELVRRTRLLDVAGSRDFAQHRRSNPEEPLAALVLILDAPSDGARLSAIAALGARLGIGIICLGSHPQARLRLQVDHHGQVTPDSPDLAGTRLYRLEADEAAQVLVTVAGARKEDAGPTVEEPAPTPTHDAEFPEPKAAATIRVRLLGPYRLEVAGVELRRGLRSAARELLAFYMLRPDGAPAEAAIDTLWPDLGPDKGSDRFWNALGNLRRRIRDALGSQGGAEVDVIGRDGQLYRIVEPELFGVDLWHFEQALAEAARAHDPGSVMTALDRAADAYGGELLEGSYTPWAEAPREDLRRRALDALTRLAELAQANAEPDRAIAALERAITVDRYAEELYRRLIRLQASLGRLDSARRTFELLRRRLAEIDADPDEDTVRLMEEIVRRRAGHR